MYTIKKESIFELVINKSTFISHLAPVTSVEEAKAYFAKIKAKHANANHNVTSYRIGNGGEYGHFSDDGEPSGTAGLPVFEVLRKNELTNLACVVTRYFGGIKLGAGGLVRAYGKVVGDNIRTLEIVPIISYVKLELAFHYSFLSEMEIWLKDYEIINRSFTDHVTLFVKVPKLDANRIVSLLTERTAGTIKIKVFDWENAPVE